MALFNMFCPRFARWMPTHAGPHGMPTRSLVIVVKDGSLNLGSDQPIVYRGANEGANGVVSGWIEDGDMVYNHHLCLRGLVLALLPDGGAHVVVMLKKLFVAFMTPDSSVVGRLG